jgi:hypothetical protein
MKSILVFLFIAPTLSQQTFDCGLRNLSLHFAKAIQPGRPSRFLSEIADALMGSPQFGGGPQWCPLDTASTIMMIHNSSLSYSSSSKQDQSSLLTIYIDAVHGNDRNSGSIDSPLQSIAAGIAAVRENRRQSSNAISSSNGALLILRKGIFYQDSTIILTPLDSYLTITSFPGETVWISGARLLTNLQWSPSPLRKQPSDNIWMASTAGIENFISTTGLRDTTNGFKRLIRARYPNADPELSFGPSLNPTSWMPPAWCPNAVCANPPSRFEPAYPFRNDTKEGTTYILGYDGDGCSEYSPPAGFNCVDNQRWSGQVPRWPAGFNADKTVLPHQPYNNVTLTDPRNPAMVNAWKGGNWFTRHWALKDYDATSMNFTFGLGGFQGAEGEDECGPFTIENVMEELDSPAEWWLDVNQQIIHVWWNVTDQTPPPSELAATNVQVLFNISGTQESPVVNLTFSNLGFRDTAMTLLEKHGAPSSGDWALQRTAALFFEGTMFVTIDNSTFERIDGLSIFLSGFNRYALIQDSEFVWLGETAIALWGYTRGSPIAGMGPDTTNGDQPRNTTITRNYFHELGIFQKQSSAVFQAESGLSIISNNVMLNGPRAMVCFNDGSLGGNLVEMNLMANSCRESGDHAAFNSWDRTAYINDIRGYNSSQKLDDVISRNIIIGNYFSQGAIDNDDSSAYYIASGNVLAYGEMGQKSDFGGHDNVHIGNVYAYVGVGGYYSEFHPHAYNDHENAFINNHVIQTGQPFGPIYIFGQTCNFTDPLRYLWNQGFIGQGGDVLPPGEYDIETALSICYNMTTCNGITFSGSNSTTRGNVYFKDTSAVIEDASWVSWTLNRITGVDIVKNNTIYTKDGTIQECGMNLSDWQNKSEWNDPGTTVQVFPSDEELLQICKDVLGMNL